MSKNELYENGTSYKAVTYNRCSTEEEAQKNALKIQVEESREIAEANGWQVLDQYVEAQSGTSAVNRSEYQRLLNDMPTDKFEIIVIKSIDRINRNLGDWRDLCYTAECFNKKIYCYLERRFVCYEDTLRDNIDAMFAEQFSYQLSKKIKNSHNRRREKKSYTNITRPIFGWDKIGKDTFIINEEEAEFYRQAFHMAEQGEGFYTIAKRLYDLGARSKSGKMISQTHWRNLLYSPRAHGDVILHKSEYNYRTRKRTIQPESEQVVVEGALPAIVSKDYQEHVISIMQSRAEASKYGNYNSRNFKNVGKYELSGKLVCGVCGAVYYRAEAKSTMGALKEWKCSNFLKNGRSGIGCNNIHVLEEEMLLLVASACKEQYSRLFGEDENIIRETLKVVKRVLSSNNEAKKLQVSEKRLEELRQKQFTLTDKLLSGIVSDELFTRMNGEIKNQINEVEKKIADIKSRMAEYNDHEKRLERIQKSLEEGRLLQEAKTLEFMNFVKVIKIYPDSHVEVELDKTKILKILDIDGVAGIEKALPDSFFEVRADYQHRTNSVKRRDNDRERIIELFRNNPELMLKEVPEILGMSKSYVDCRVKELKREGILSYERHQHYGKWLVESGK